MSLNLSYHLKNELNLKYFNELISNDNIYLQKYSKLAEIKYCGYQPTELQAISANIETYKAEV